ncbi:beta-ketoacyl synthase N-terminal-like domain-containing protein [Streptomyces sp. AK02-04a]|uniref:beta-ketoacyl synthase N-terminal-like domain-containing protein n=1 Tax=Streptomyces sp. AK02-04a TaxID=3028649 RepID=UPI0029A7FEFE|nr:beta-ketoacyl synthase N-terminal-like domain-containing protein [Streptomyces sp. AK02-04a]MDX3763525.1 beta-ketoacyl synthase N-terminal-like domain-containing protein [Streptomyces sp. AK02-04a]
MATSRSPAARTVISGCAVLSPLAEDLDAFRDALHRGQSAISHDPVEAPVHTPGGLPGAWLRVFSLSAWAHRHLTPLAADRLVRVAHRCALPAQTATCVAASAIADARLEPADIQGLVVLVAGNNLSLAQQARAALAAVREPPAVRASYALDHLDTDCIGAISEATGATAAGWTVGAASASGNAALIQAWRTVATGEAERVLVVAPVTDLSLSEFLAYQRAGAMATLAGHTDPDPVCAPFDRSRTGFVYGQGAAAVVVERLDSARSRSAPARAELLGHGQRLDGHRGARPEVGGQVAAMQAALKSAGLDVIDVDAVNAHATGSLLGDEVEAASLLAVFGEGSRVRVNATKALTGHCLSAAGLIEAVACSLQLTYGFIHPNPALREPIDDRLPLVGRAAEERETRVMLSNSFAFSGINTAVVLAAVDREMTWRR